MADKANAPPPVISADDAAFKLPPPSYEEIMGVYQTSVKEVQPEPQQLAYIDIMPRCLKQGNIKGKVPPTFDSFSAIIDGANRWLVDNPALAVWKCESVERLLNVAPDGSLTYDLNSMLRHDSTFGFCVYIKGIRLWLTKAVSGSKPQQLGLRNILPERVTIELPMTASGLYRRGRIIVGGEVKALLHGGFHSYKTFEGLSDTITKLNKKLQDDPIPGTILTIETDTVKAFDQANDGVNPESTCWSENKDRYKRITQVIRIFYVHGPSANEQIGIEDISPDVTQAPDGLKPGKFEDFDKLVTKLGHWAPAHQGCRVVNIQQFDAKIHRSFSELSISSDSTDEVVSAYSERRMAKTLRVFYVTSASVAAPINANYVSSRLFLPARLGQRSFETMTQTMERIDYWLRAAGQSVYSVETVQLLFNTSNLHGADVNRADYTLNALSGKHWITAIRVYFPGPFAEPDPSLLPPQPAYQTGSGSCAIM